MKCLLTLSIMQKKNNNKKFDKKILKKNYIYIFICAILWACITRYVMIIYISIKTNVFT